MNFYSVKERVANLLRNYPALRSNDDLLIIRYWNLYDNLEVEYKPGITSAHTIIRVRQRLQEEAKEEGNQSLLPSQNVIEAREKKCKELTEFFRELKSND